MSAVVVVERPVELVDDQVEIPAGGQLFQVWIDLEFGEGEPDWWWNSPPQALAHALAESQEARATGWVTQVLPEGQNPRPDGRWDNP